MLLVQWTAHAKAHQRGAHFRADAADAAVAAAAAAAAAGALDRQHPARLRGAALWALLATVVHGREGLRCRQ